MTNVAVATGHTSHDNGQYSSAVSRRDVLLRVLDREHQDVMRDAKLGALDVDFLAIDFGEWRRTDVHDSNFPGFSSERTAGYFLTDNQDRDLLEAVAERSTLFGVTIDIHALLLHDFFWAPYERERLAAQIMDQVQQLAANDCGPDIDPIAFQLLFDFAGDDWALMHDIWAAFAPGISSPYSIPTVRDFTVMHNGRLKRDRNRFGGNRHPYSEWKDRNPARMTKHEILAELDSY
jgi:hypothetical protein